MEKRKYFYYRWRNSNARNVGHGKRLSVHCSCLAPKNINISLKSIHILRGLQKLRLRGKHEEGRSGKKCHLIIASHLKNTFKYGRNEKSNRPLELYKTSLKVYCTFFLLIMVNISIPMTKQHLIISQTERGEEKIIIKKKTIEENHRL